MYEDEEKARALGKVVLVTACNFGFVNHLHNFKCFAERLGMKFLVISMDAQVHEYITKKTSMVSFLMFNGTIESQEFRSQHFNMLTARKKKAVHDIMAEGYDVLFSDTDVAMIQDPLPHLRWSGVDYVHSLNFFCQL